MIHEMYFLDDCETGIKILVFEDVTPEAQRLARRAQQTKCVITGFQHLLGEEVTLVHEASGAPLLASHPDVQISISHSHQAYALMLHGKKSVGIDLQKKRPGNFPSALHYFLSEEEMTLPHSDHDLYVLWCAKEALYKRCRGHVASYKEDLCIEAQGSRTLLCKAGEDFVQCTHLSLGDEFVLVYCI
jgi:phosphopantetheinyl transferase